MKIARISFLSLALLAGCGVQGNDSIRIEEQKMPAAQAGCCSGEGGGGGGCCSDEGAPQAKAKDAKAAAGGQCCGACAPEAAAKPK